MQHSRQVLSVRRRHEHQLQDDELRPGAERARVRRGEGAPARLLHRQGARQGDRQGEGRDDHLLGGVQGQQGPAIRGRHPGSAGSSGGQEGAREGGRGCSSCRGLNVTGTHSTTLLLWSHILNIFSLCTDISTKCVLKILINESSILLTPDREHDPFLFCHPINTKLYNV